MANSLGRRSAKTFDPSSGGIGIRLKMASKRFMRTIVRKNQWRIYKAMFVAGKIAFKM